jgi:hypothetical protein
MKRKLVRQFREFLKRHGRMAGWDATYGELARALRHAREAPRRYAGFAEPPQPWEAGARPRPAVPIAALAPALPRAAAALPAVSQAPHVPAHIRPHLTAEELAHFTRRQHAESLAAHFQALPPDRELADLAQTGRAKRGWYARSTEHLRALFGQNTPRFVALLAATSPRIPVKRNLLKALQVYRHWHHAGRPANPAAVAALLNSPGILQGKFASHLPNVVHALTTPEEHIRLSGEKVENFRRVLLGDLHGVVNDAWIAHMAGIDPAALGTHAAYHALTAKIRRVASRLGWYPAEVQETLWSAFRALARQAGRGLAPREALRQLTHEDVAGNVDFATLLREHPLVQEELARVFGRRRRAAGPPAGGGGYRGPGTPEDPALTGRAVARVSGGLERAAERAAGYPLIVPGGKLGYGRGLTPREEAHVTALLRAGREDEAVRYLRSLP